MGPHQVAPANREERCREERYRVDMSSPCLGYPTRPIQRANPQRGMLPALSAQVSAAGHTRPIRTTTYRRRCGAVYPNYPTNQVNTPSTVWMPETPHTRQATCWYSWSSPLSRMMFGVTGRSQRSARGSCRTSVANTARSAPPRPGRGLVRRSTATSWRSTSNSMSLWSTLASSAEAAREGARRSGTAGEATQQRSRTAAGEHQSLLVSGMCSIPEPHRAGRDPCWGGSGRAVGVVVEGDP